MADFLSSEWFSELNATLGAASPVPFEGEAAVVRVVIEFFDAPTSGAHAITFTLSPDGARVDAGDHLFADAIVRLSYADASALTEGLIQSEVAIREGRIKVRGDINAIVPVLGRLQRAHPGAK